MLLIISINLPNLFLILFVIIAALLSLYYLALIAKYAFAKQKRMELKNAKDCPPVSVVIVARDQAYLLINTLHSFLTLDYPDFEVVVVNDNSKDETQLLLQELSHKYSNLHIVNLFDSVTTIRGKKFALSLGIKSAKYEHIVLTEANCQPVSPDWLYHIASRFVRKTKVVFAFSTFKRQKGLFNLLLRYDNFVTAMSSFAYTLKGMPVMANGNNLAYTKSYFFSKKDVFFAHARLPFGENDILINQSDKQGICNVEDHPDSFIVRPALRFPQWTQMKKHACITRQYYAFWHRFLLKSHGFLSLLFYCALVLSAIYVVPPFVATQSVHHIIMFSTFVGAFLIKEVLQYVIYAKSALKLGEKELIPFIFLYDVFFAVFNPLIYFNSKFVRRKWR